MEFQASAADAGRRILPLAGAVGATAVVSYVALTLPFVMGLTAGGATALALTFTPAAAFIALALLGRNVADEFASTTVVGTLNSGALLGILIVGVALLRILGMRRVLGMNVALLLWGLLFIWFAVGYFNYGGDPTIERELIRTTSIVGLGVFAANVVNSRSDIGKLLDIVIATSLVPAFVALWQMANGVERAAGTLSHPNTAASIFVIGLMLAVWRLVEGRRLALPQHTARYLAAASVFAVALLATRSIGGIVHGLVTLLVYSLLASRGGMRRGVIAVAAVGLVFAFAFSPFGRERVQELRTGLAPAQAGISAQPNSLLWRFEHWSLLMDEWREKPILGHGAGTTASLVAPNGYPPHNDYVRFLVETGVVGTAVFTGALVALLLGLFRATRESPWLSVYGALVLALVAGAVVHGAVDNVWSQTAVMYELAVLVGSIFGLLRAEASAVPR
jgi:O-antigen ligase